MAFEISFERIVGHARPKAILRSAIVTGRVAHAYLFHGEAHIGKFAMAMAFAKADLCSTALSSRAASLCCHHCSSCHAVDAGSHPDVYTIQPDGTPIKIEQIRELKNAISYKPLLGSRKWFIIDEADALTPEAANSFLKTLEEPPDHSTLILVTARPQALPPTILSRCQGVRFDRPPQQEVWSWLEKHRQITSDDAKLLTALSMGKVGIAVEADPAVLKAERDRVFEALSNDHLEDLSELFSVPERLATTPDQLLKTLDAVEIYLRDILISQHSPEASLLIHQDIGDRLRQWGRTVSPDQVLETLSLLYLLKRAAPRNLNHALVLETVLLKLRDAVIGVSASGEKLGQEPYRERS